MTILVTGAAGFIGFHVSNALLERGERVLGIDNLDASYDVRLKQARLEILQKKSDFSFLQRDIADESLVDFLATIDHAIESIVHLAAQSAVRQSLNEPFAYARSNIHGHLVCCELARRLQEKGSFKHFVFASTSAVYGGNEQIPSRLEHPADRPLSLYGASKRCDEIITQSYVSLFSIPSTGLRFFTVYGTWGRPDMAISLFTDSILRGREVVLFNEGEMERDFVYIDDIVDGIVRALDRPPANEMKLYNLGSGGTESLGRVVSVLEAALGIKAGKRLEPLQPGDPVRSYGDISESERDLGYVPKFSIDEGIPLAVAWYRDFYNI